MTLDEYKRFVTQAGQAVVATVTPQGRPEAALVELAVTPEGDLLFNTKTAARKVANLAASSRVAVAVGWPEVTLQIEGEAVLLEGEALEQGAALFTSRYPEKPADWSVFSLYRIHPEWMRYCGINPAGGPPIIAEGLPD